MPPDEVAGAARNTSSRLRSPGETGSSRTASAVVILKRGVIIGWRGAGRAPGVGTRSMVLADRQSMAVAQQPNIKHKPEPRSIQEAEDGWVAVDYNSKPF